MEVRKMNKKGEGNKLAGFGIAAFLIFVVLGMLLLLGFDTVNANHLGVKVRLGKMIGVQEPGMQWTGLFTHVYQYDLRRRKNVIDLSGVNSAVDKTGQAVFATININYRIIPTKQTVIDLYEQVGTNDIIDDRLNINAIVSEGFKQATVMYDALEILEKRQEVKELAKANIHNNFPAEYFEIVDIVVTNIDFSEAFKLAIEQKKIAEQDALKEENQLQVVIFQQQQVIEESKAEAEKMRLQKTQLTTLLNEQKMIEAWDGSLPDTIIIGGGDSSNLPIFLQLATGKGGE